MKLFTNNLYMNLFFAHMDKVCVGLFSELDNDISVIFTFGTSHPKHCRNNNGKKKESIQYGHHARIKEMDSPTNQLVEFNRNDKNDLRIA